MIKTSGTNQKLITIHLSDLRNMKLYDLHSVAEGMLDKLGKGLRAKLHALSMRGQIDRDIHDLLARAKAMDGSLLDHSPASRRWWEQLLNHYSIPKQNREDCISQVSGIVRQKIIPFLDDDNPEPYLRGGLDTRAKRRTAFKKMVSQIAQDRQRLRESIVAETWSHNVRSKAVNELVAALIITHVETYAKNLKQQGDGQEQQENQASDTNEAHAQQLANKLWQAIGQHYSGQRVLTSDDAAKYINAIKKRGYRIRWMGNKTKRQPNGDQPPIVVLAHQ